MQRDTDTPKLTRTLAVEEEDVIAKHIKTLHFCYSTIVSIITSN